MIDVVCAIIIDNGGVLAAQRSEHMSCALKWEFPGGKIEANETPEECLHREIKEELDISIEILDTLTHSIYRSEKITIKLIPFIVKQISGQIKLKEHRSHLWLSKNELENLDWSDADIPIVKNFIDTYPLVNSIGEKS